MQSIYYVNCETTRGLEHLAWNAPTKIKLIRELAFLLPPFHCT